MREGWEYKKLGEVANVTDYVANGSFATLRENVRYMDKMGYAILVRLADFSNDFDSTHFVYIDEHAYNFLSKSKLYGGEIIMSNVGSIGKSFICPKLSMPMSLAPNSIVINTTNNKFYFYYFNSKSFQSSLKKISSKTALPKFNKTQFKSLTAPVPPLSEQQRIVSELDLLSSIIEKKKAQLKEYDQLAQSIFYDMFGDPVENPKGWEVKKLGEVCSKISDGVHAKPKYTESGMPFISVVNINKRYLDFDNCKFVSYEDGEIINKRSKPQRNDVLYTKVGATYGIPALVDTDKDFCLYVSVCLIKPLHEIIDSVFLSNMMALPYVKNQADERIKGIGVPDLHLNQISAFNIILPPLPLQQSFASKIEAIERQKALIQQSIAEVQMLFDSRMDDWFA